MTKLELANEQIRKVIGYLKQNEKYMDYMDLKLHDVSFYDFETDFPLCFKNDTNDEYSYFYLFCEDNYNMFVEDLAENFNINFEKMKVQLGRTSSFYLQNFYDKNIDCLLENLSYDDACMNFTEFENGKIKPYGEYTEEDEEVQEELDYFIDDFYNSVVKRFKDIIIVYDYIEDFKKNQVEYFKEYLQSQEEELEEEQKRQQEEIYTNKCTCDDIQRKYNIYNEDMNTLRKYIHDWSE